MYLYCQSFKKQNFFFLEKEKYGINKILICLGGADEKTGSTQGSANQRLALKGSANQRLALKGSANQKLGKNEFQ